MNYPSLSLEKKQIDDAFGIHQHPSPGRTNIVLKSISSKFLPNQTNQCEQCEYKTSKYNSMYSHMRVKHTDLRIKCTERNFSHPFQTKVNTHFKQVHLGQKRADHRSDICRKRTCSRFYTKNCTELESHAALSCDKCNYSTAEVITLSFTLKVYMMELFTSANIAHHILHTKERGHWQNTSFISIQKHFSLVLIRNASLKHSTNKLWKCTPNQSTKALFATNVIQWIAVTKHCQRHNGPRV